MSFVWWITDLFIGEILNAFICNSILSIFVKYKDLKAISCIQLQ